MRPSFLIQEMRKNTIKAGIFEDFCWILWEDEMFIFFPMCVACPWEGEDDVSFASRYIPFRCAGAGILLLLTDKEVAVWVFGQG